VESNNKFVISHNNEKQTFHQIDLHCNHVSSLILFLAALSRALSNQLINRGVFKDGHNAANSLEGVAGVSLKAEAACDAADDTLLPIQPQSLHIVSQKLSTS